MTLVIFFIFILGVVLFVVSTVIVLYHFYRFRLEDSHHKLLIPLFIIGSVVLLYLEFYFYGLVRWEEVSAIWDDYFIRTTL